MTLSRLDLAIGQIRFAREYTLSLIADLEPSDWFRQPTEGVSHPAWQVGHLAMAQYGLCLFRMRGRADVDQDLMSSAFRKKFSKGTTPDPDPVKNPSPEEIRSVFDKSTNRRCWNCRLSAIRFSMNLLTCHTLRSLQNSGDCCFAHTTKCCTPVRSDCCGDCWARHRCDDFGRHPLLLTEPPAADVG